MYSIYWDSGVVSFVISTYQLVQIFSNRQWWLANKNYASDYAWRSNPKMKIWDRVVFFWTAAYSLRGSNGRLFILNFAKCEVCFENTSRNATNIAGGCGLVWYFLKFIVKVFIGFIWSRQIHSMLYTIYSSLYRLHVLDMYIYITKIFYIQYTQDQGNVDVRSILPHFLLHIARSKG